MEAYTELSISEKYVKRRWSMFQISRNSMVRHLFI